MRVLVTGAGGFVGGHIAAALAVSGFEVLRAVRPPASGRRPAGASTVYVDFGRALEARDWIEALAGVDAVVNAAGILHERGREGFDAVHRAAPCALFAACAERGVKRVIQISALGDPADAAFLASKHAGDACLVELPLHWTVLRPSLLYSTAGSYGGTSLLRALAALPWILPLPGGGAQRLQPLAVEDLARAVVVILKNDASSHRQVLEAVGPEVISLVDYLSAWRRWFGFAPARRLRVPKRLVAMAAWFGDQVSRGPLASTMYRMLERGNVGAAGSAERFERMIGIKPRTLAQALAAPCHVQHRWHARLYFARPLLRLSLALLWILSGAVGFMLPVEQSAGLLASLGLAEAGAYLVYGASALDIALGLALALRYQVRLIGFAMLLLLLAYTAVLGIAAPALWLEPFGALIKNIPLIPAVIAMLAMEEAR